MKKLRAFYDALAEFLTLLRWTSNLKLLKIRLIASLQST